MNTRTALIPAAAILFAACTVTKKEPPAADTEAVAVTPSVADTGAGTSSAATPPDTTAKPATPLPEEMSWTVNARGIGNVTTGMTPSEANAVTGNALTLPAKNSECDYIRPKSAPKGVALMFEDGQLSRVDVTSGTVATVEGAKIGDSEARIKSLYPDAVVTAHKYLPKGHYLTVTPAGAANYRIVFESDGAKVTKYRSGKMPAVEYVEGCG
jgi:hypothetical protein